MSVTDFAAPTVTIKRGEKELTLRGLNAGDVVTLMSDPSMRIAIEMLVEDFQKQGGMKAMDEAGSSALIWNLVKQAPALAARLIAVSADEPEQAGFIESKWSLAFQVECLIETARLTFEDAGGFAALLGKVTAVLGEINSKAKKPSTAKRIGM